MLDFCNFLRDILLDKNMFIISSLGTECKWERDGNTRPPDLHLEKSMQVRKQQLELDMEQQTGSK